MTSEDFSRVDCLESSLFSQPAEVNSWCQSITLGQPWPLSPPDTASEPDMSAQWSQTSMPEDQWYTGPAQDNSTYVQPTGSEWDTQTMFSSTQDFQSMDACAWTQSGQGSLDTGLSPVLSHKSQSTHTLNSCSEPEFSILPPGVDFSYSSEPQWSFAGPMLCAGAQPMPVQMPGNAFVPSPDAHVAPSRTDTAAMPHLPLDYAGYQGTSQPAYYPQEGGVARPLIPYQAITPRRPLLPRTESSLASNAVAFAHAPSQRPIKPLIQGDARSRGSSHSVSTSIGPFQDSQRMPTTRSIAPSPVDARRSQRRSAPAVGMRRARTQPEDMPGNALRPAYPGVADPTAEDFNAFIQYDQEDQSSPAGLTRSAHHEIVE